MPTNPRIKAAPLPPAELLELADEMRISWRSLSRCTHVGGGSDLYQRQQFWVLGALRSGPKRMTELAELARTSQASLTGIVDRLEGFGLVERLRSDEDRRVVEVAITPAGLAEKERVQVGVAERLSELLAPLTPAESGELLRLFRKINCS
jgi:DNA-binding MarR family transcriptional regulator